MTELSSKKSGPVVTESLGKVPKLGAQAESKSKPVRAWAIAGGAILAFQLYVWISWMTGPYFKRVPAGPSDPPTLDEEPPRLFQARAELDAEGERRVVLNLLRDDLAAKLDGHVVRWQRELAASYETWERKYAVSLREIRAGRERAAGALDGFLKELGYAE